MAPGLNPRKRQGASFQEAFVRASFDEPKRAKHLMHHVRVSFAKAQLGSDSRHVLKDAVILKKEPLNAKAL